MALQAAPGFSSFDVAGETAVEDVSDVLEAALYEKPSFIGYVGIGESTLDVEHSWVSDQLNPTAVTVSGTTDAGADADSTNDTEWTLNAGQGGVLAIGALLKNLSGGGEVVQVIAKAGDTITVTRGYGGTAAIAVAAGDEWTIIGQPKQENSEPSDDVSTVRGRWSNYTEIFERTVNMSRNQIVRAMYGLNNGSGGGEWAHQLQQRAIEVRREMAIAALHSVPPSQDQGGSDSTYRTMRGMLSFIGDLGGIVHDSSADASATFSFDVINEVVAQIVDNGGEPNAIFVPTPLYQTIQGFQLNQIQLDRSDRFRGQTVARLETDTGPVLDVIREPFMGAGQSLISTTNKLSLVPFQGANWFMAAGRQFKDGQEQRILGEYTLRVDNPTEAHALITNAEAA